MSIDTISKPLLRSTLMALCVVFMASVFGYSLLRSPLLIGNGTIISAASLLLFIFVWVIYALPSHNHRRFGPANVVTAIRAAIVCLVGTTVLFSGERLLLEPALPALIALAISALALDWVDGYLARRSRLASPLGARFDMEIDALFILVLSVTALLLEKAGLWVLLIGLMRYGFVLAQYPFSWLRVPLQDSFRRKLICVVQVGALCIIMLPFITPPVSTVIAAVALLLLSYSFAADVLYLLRHADEAK
ncbi:CDP-alcohol phosphatidyltransferase family protein [Allorhizobium terrae]|uniref:CDP-alcohol phosphatidyltransferase family protein n=1 Tax=Allorhizobium terrae TaxID=1848972 RepID=A0A4S3ZVH5_9HYPH|nr:CDP-alcohol phosphatidyltransferase family protein [Allorhizobium terrae]THF49613.1 CDP-alcohol phosphatidyltransferase family protein [Allorhizobium terrae]